MMVGNCLIYVIMFELMTTVHYFNFHVAYDKCAE